MIYSPATFMMPSEVLICVGLPAAVLSIVWTVIYVIYLLSDDKGH